MVTGGWTRYFTDLYGRAGRTLMRLQLNGEPREFDAPMTVASLVEKLGLDARKIAIERNLEIVPRSTYAQVALAEGDRVEIVNFVGGG